MFPLTNVFYGFGWVFPIIMLIMMVSCFFMMRSHKGPMMMGRPGCCGKGSHVQDPKKGP